MFLSLNDDALKDCEHVVLGLCEGSKHALVHTPDTAAPDVFLIASVARPDYGSICGGTTMT